MLHKPSAPITGAGHVGRRNLLFLALAGAVAARAGHAMAPADPHVPLSQLYGSLVALMRLGDTTPFGQRYQQLAPAIDRTFDLATVLRNSIGASWATLDDGTQAALRTAFRQFTIATYVASFDKYDGERFEVSPSLRQAGAEQVVETRIIRNDAEPIRLDYVMRQEDFGWRAIDVLLDGTISRVAVQRSDFRSVLRRGDAAGLIASLQRKAADLSGGSLLDS